MSDNPSGMPWPPSEFTDFSQVVVDVGETSPGGRTSQPDGQDPQPGVYVSHNQHTRQFVVSSPAFFPYPASVICLRWLHNQPKVAAVNLRYPNHPKKQSESSAGLAQRSQVRLVVLDCGLSMKHIVQFLYFTYPGQILHQDRPKTYNYLHEYLHNTDFCY